MPFPLIPVLGALALGGTTFGLGTWLGSSSATPTIVAEPGSTIYPQQPSNTFGLDFNNVGVLVLAGFAIYAISKK